MRVDGVCEFSLLDAMAVQTRCEYLSDLKNLQDWERIKLSQALKQVPANTATLFEWNDALTYLSGAHQEQSCEAARGRLIELLSAPRLRRQIEPMSKHNSKLQMRLEEEVNV